MDGPGGRRARGVLSFLSWDRAGQVAGVVSAVVDVAALGVGVYGDASAQGGVAFSNTGVINGSVALPARRTAVSGHPLQVEKDGRGRLPGT